VSDPEDFERCEPCQLAAAVTVSHEICKQLSEAGEDCSRLLDEVQRGDRPVSDYLAEVYVRTAKVPELRQQMEEVLEYLRDGLNRVKEPPSPPS